MVSFRVRSAVLGLVAVLLVLTGGPVIARSDSDSPTIGVVVAHEKAPFDNVSRKRLRALYLGQRTQINGVTVTPIRPKIDRVNKLLRSRILRMSRQEEKRYWLEATFKGTVHHVQRMERVESIVSYVRTHRTALTVLPLEIYRSVMKGKTLPPLKELTFDGYRFLQEPYELKLPPSESEETSS